MTVQLDKLLELDRPEVVTEHARFYCHVPHVAPLAYLHIIFNPAPRGVLDSISAQLDLPEILVSFLQAQNGASLFSEALRIDGVVDPHRLHSRRNYYAQVPYSLINNNRHPVMKLFPEWLGIGDYGFDGSRILLNRGSGEIQAVDQTGGSLGIWQDLETFLVSELKRVRALFSPSGQCLVDAEFTVPRHRRVN